MTPEQERRLARLEAEHIWLTHKPAKQERKVTWMRRPKSNSLTYEMKRVQAGNKPFMEV